METWEVQHRRNKEIETKRRHTVDCYRLEQTGVHLNEKNRSKPTLFPIKTEPKEDAQLSAASDGLRGQGGRDNTVSQLAK